MGVVTELILDRYTLNLGVCRTLGVGLAATGRTGPHRATGPQAMLTGPFAIGAICPLANGPMGP